jgi:nucleoside-specific outer membrane channel protein Tsx
LVAESLKGEDSSIWGMCLEWNRKWEDPEWEGWKIQTVINKNIKWRDEGKRQMIAINGYLSWRRHRFLESRRAKE